MAFCTGGSDDDTLHEECGVFGVWNVPDAAAVTALEQTLRTARGTTSDLQADLSPLMRDLRSSVANLRDTTEALRRNPSQTILGAPPPPPNRERR